jgi:hypothetical protein
MKRGYPWPKYTKVARYPSSRERADVWDFWHGGKRWHRKIARLVAHTILMVKRGDWHV